MKFENLAVCLPYSQGIDVYIRRAGEEELLICPETFDDRAISDIPLTLAQPRLVVLVGKLWGTFLGQILIQNTDLCVIPDRWLEHIPYWEGLQRAEFVIQLIEAHLSAPIRLYGAKDRESLDVLRQAEISWMEHLLRKPAIHPDDTR